MEVSTFVHNYRKAFGEKPGLPVVFWYSDEPFAQTERINGCFFKAMADVRSGTPISLNAETVTCGGGKFYTGFAEMAERIPKFVSLNEKYKQTPELTPSLKTPVEGDAPFSDYSTPRCVFMWKKTYSVS